MKDLMQVLLQGAKQNLIQNKSIIPVGFGIEQGKIKLPVLMPWRDDDQKYEAIYSFGKVCKERGLYQAIIITDAAMKAMSPEQIKDPLERPLLYPKSMRQECIIVVGQDFKINESIFLMQVYSDADNIISFIREPEFIDYFSGEIIKTLKKGYGA